MAKAKAIENRINPKKFRDGTINTVDIGNSPEYREWQNKKYESVRNKPRNESLPIYLLMGNHLQDNRKTLPEIFGKPHFKLKFEFLFHSWHVEHDGVDFLVMTAKTKGTCIEVIEPEYADENFLMIKNGKQIVSFVEWLCDEIEKVQ